MAALAAAASTVTTGSSATSSLPANHSSTTSLQELEDQVVREGRISWRQLETLWASGRSFSSPRIVHVDLTGFNDNLPGGNERVWTAILEKVFHNFPSVHSFDVSGPHFTDAHLTTLCQHLRNRLHRLSLQSCSDVTTLSPLRDCALIKDLLIRNCCQLTSDKIREISRFCPRLSHLSLQQEPRDARLSEVLPSFRSLSFLDVSGSFLRDEDIVAIVENCQNLDTLFLHSDDALGVSQMLPLVGRRLSRLSHLSIDWMYAQDQSYIEEISRGFSNLQFLRIGFCSQDLLARQIFAAFPRVPNLHLNTPENREGYDCRQLTDSALPEGSCSFSHLRLKGCLRMTRPAIERLIARSPELGSVTFPDGSRWTRSTNVLSSSSTSTTPAAAAFQIVPLGPPPPRPRRAQESRTFSGKVGI